MDECEVAAVRRIRSQLGQGDSRLVPIVVATEGTLESLGTPQRAITLAYYSGSDGRRDDDDFHRRMVRGSTKSSNSRMAGFIHSFRMSRIGVNATAKPMIRTPISKTTFSRFMSPSLVKGVGCFIGQDQGGGGGCGTRL